MNIGVSKRIAACMAAAGVFLLLPAADAAAGTLEKRKAQYDNLVQIISAEEGMDADFVHAVIRHESAYNQWAVSSAGAQGLMQLMPATAAAYGVKDVFDAEENIRGGVKFLKYLKGIYPDGDPNSDRMVLAAYNAGQSAIKKYNGKIPPYAETQAYIRRVLATYNKPASRKTKIYEFRDASGKTVLTNDPRMIAQLSGQNPK